MTDLIATPFRAGLMGAGDKALLLDLGRARLPGAPINLSPSGGQLAIMAADHGKYFVRDVAANGGFALPSTASTPVGTEFSVQLTGSPAALPLPAITVAGGGNITLNGVSASSLATFGRGEVIRFRRVGSSYDAEVLKNGTQCFLVATSSVSTFITGRVEPYSPIPAMNVVSGEGSVLFNLASGVVTIPVSGNYFVQLSAQFNTDGGLGGAGILIGPAPFASVGSAFGNQYMDIPTGLTYRMQCNFTARLAQGTALEFGYALTNSFARIRPQDFGLTIGFLGR